MASNIAVSVSHAQISQNKMNQAACSGELRTDCRNVDPDAKRMTATTIRTNIVFRRAFRSRMSPRVTPIIKEVAPCAFSSDELFDTID